MEPMEYPEIHAFIDEMPHRASELNAMGIAVMELVARVNQLTSHVTELEAALAAAPKTAARKTA